jgi:hypothetical protein
MKTQNENLKELEIVKTHDYWPYGTMTYGERVRAGLLRDGYFVTRNDYRLGWVDSSKEATRHIEESGTVRNTRLDYADSEITWEQWRDSIYNGA